MAEMVVSMPAGKAEVVSQKSANAVLGSKEFHHLVSRRWTVSTVLLALLFATYYGFILLIAGNKEAMSQKIGEVTTIAIPIGIAVIVIAFLLTAFYVYWANQSYDPEVERLKAQLKK